MNNLASVFILLFLSITFLQSGCDKIFGWKGTVEWLKSHFSKVMFLKNNVPLALFTILILELCSGALSFIGVFDLLICGGKTIGLYGAFFSCASLLFLLLGQRLAKDYDGARTIVIYFIPTVWAVFLLS